MQAFSQIVEQKHGVQRGSGIEPPANPSIDLIRAVAEDYLEEARANIAASGAQRLPVVLLVSDDRIIGTVTKVVLKDIPHTLIEACSSEDVLRIAVENSPDLIIGEANQNGGEAFNVISEAAMSHIPILLLDRQSFLEHLYTMHSAVRLPHAAA